ncbi:MAG: FeoB-associated Cys-rich membrane protein [Oscillospiraceae bacterium]|nr:FeoB-associated Cys-rich membrane protein [Oscillospiraceae bacterium]
MELLPTLIAALVVILIVFFAVRSMVKKRKSGNCGCGCENCNAGCSSRKKERP